MNEFENKNNELDDKPEVKAYKKISFSQIVLVILLFIIAFCTITSLLKLFSLRDGKFDVDDRESQIRSLIDEKFLYSDDIDIDDIKNHDPDKILEALKDPYSEYLDKQEMRILAEEMQGKFFGIGVKFSKGEDEKIVVREFLKGSSAESQGIKVGDALSKVEGENVNVATPKDLEKVIRKIRGKENTVVNLEFYRSSTGETIKRAIPRKEVRVSSVSGKILQDGIGYIKISEFISGTDTEFEQQVETLRDLGAKSFVIDLRDNPGGAVLSTTKILDYILPEGRILYSKNKDGIDRQWSSDEENKMNEDIVVLINENSASASEIFAGAMQDFGKGKIIGKKSFGKGVIQQIFSLGDGSAVKLTVSEYYTPKHQRINKRGVIPDIEVERGSDTDLQLDRAIKELK